MGLPAKKDDRVYRYGDYRTWSDDERWELIDGVAYDMTPAPGRIHQRMLVELTLQFGDFLRDKPCELYVAPFDVMLPVGDEVDDDVETVVQPDLLIVCDKSKSTERGIRGAPDLVVEILSPSTAKKDLREKLRAYERAGVREYWVIQPTDHTLMVFRLDERGQYGRPEIFGVGDQAPVGVLDALTIDLQRVFAGEA